MEVKTMKTTVKAAVMEAPGRVVIHELPMPKLEPGAAIGRMLYSGICGTDKHSYQGESTQFKGTENAFEIPYNIIPGHENSLEIVEITPEGAANLDFDGFQLKVGDKVTMCPDVVCGKCWYCKNIASYPWCDSSTRFCYGTKRPITDGKGLYGGWAEYIYIEPGTRLYKVPDGLPDDVASMAEVMACTYSLDKAKEFNGFSLEGFNFNDTVVIQGMGPLGLSHLIKARQLGAGKIICTDISEYKLNLAKEFGADITLNVAKTTLEERIETVMQETGGRGAALALECVGRPQAVREGLSFLRRSGMYLELGMFVDVGDCAVNFHEICAKSLRVVGMYNHSHNCYKDTMEMMLRTLDRVPWDKFFSHRFPLEKADEAVQVSMTEESMKVLIDLPK